MSIIFISLLFRKTTNLNPTKNKIINELKQGICEITIVSEHSSMSRTISATLSPNHLPETQSNISNKPNIVVLWDVVGEKWNSLHVSNIGEVERLTGHGIKDRGGEALLLSLG